LLMAKGSLRKRAPGGVKVVTRNDGVGVGIAALPCCLYAFARVARDTVNRTPI
jgi:hypothetical protein